MLKKKKKSFLTCLELLNQAQDICLRHIGSASGFPICFKYDDYQTACAYTIF